MFGQGLAEEGDASIIKKGGISLSELSEIAAIAGLISGKEIFGAVFTGKGRAVIGELITALGFEGRDADSSGSESRGDSIIAVDRPSHVVRVPLGLFENGFKGGFSDKRRGERENDIGRDAKCIEGIARSTTSDFKADGRRTDREGVMRSSDRLGRSGFVEKEDGDVGGREEGKFISSLESEVKQASGGVNDFGRGVSGRFEEGIIASGGRGEFEDVFIEGKEVIRRGRDDIEAEPEFFFGEAIGKVEGNRQAIEANLELDGRDGSSESARSFRDLNEERWKRSI